MLQKYAIIYKHTNIYATKYTFRAYFNIHYRIYMRNMQYSEACRTRNKMLQMRHAIIYNKV